MTQNEIIEMAKEAGVIFGWPVYHDRIEIFAKLVEDKVTARYMQLFLDPENQPTQFGTVTTEYMWNELNAVISAARLLHNLTLADSDVKISTSSSKKRDAIAAAGDSLREAIRARGEA